MVEFEKPLPNAKQLGKQKNLVGRNALCFNIRFLLTCSKCDDCHAH